MTEYMPLDNDLIREIYRSKFRKLIKVLNERGNLTLDEILRARDIADTANNRIRTFNDLQALIVFKVVTRVDNKYHLELIP